MKHSKGEPHITAVKMEADLAASKRDGGIIMALQQVMIYKWVVVMLCTHQSVSCS